MNTAYKPELFELSDPERKRSLTELREKNTQLQVLDTFEFQVKELIKSRRISNPVPDHKWDEVIREYCNGKQLHECGTWIHYPWSNRLIHLLDKSDFIELRTNRNLYKITTEEKNLLQYKKIGIIGLSVGKAVATTLAMERVCGHIKLADFDDIELSNLNRIQSGLHNLKLNKAIIAAREISEFDPYLTIECFTEGITEKNIQDFLIGTGKLDLLIDECDSMEMKIKSRLAARKHGIPVIMETSDRGMLDIERFDLEPQRDLFHGRIKDFDLSKTSEWDAQMRFKLVSAIVGADTASEKLLYSYSEIGKSIGSWPQLASAVMLGGATCTDTARRILLGSLSSSGRYYIDLEKIIS